MLAAPRSPSRRRPATVAVAVAVGVAVLGPHAALAGTPPTLLSPQRPGDAVTITPAAARAPDGTAEFDVEVGTEAESDVVVAFRLVLPSVDDGGIVAIGDAVAPGTVSPGARLRPGEGLRVTASELEQPTLVVVDVRAADGTPAPTTPAALVLPGALGDAPSVSLVDEGDTVEATISAGAPLLVAVRLRGAQSSTYPDRLVLPDDPVVLTTPAAGWPLASEVAVTDEGGRTVTTATGTTAMVLLAGVLVALAGTALLVVVRRRHRLSDA